MNRCHYKKKKKKNRASAVFSFQTKCKQWLSSTVATRTTSSLTISPQEVRDPLTATTEKISNFCVHKLITVLSFKTSIRIHHFASKRPLWNILFKFTDKMPSVLGGLPKCFAQIAMPYVVKVSREKWKTISEINPFYIGCTCSGEELSKLGEPEQGKRKTKKISLLKLQHLKHALQNWTKPNFHTVKQNCSSGKSPFLVPRVILYNNWFNKSPCFIVATRVFQTKKIISWYYIKADL